MATSPIRHVWGPFRSTEDRAREANPYCRDLRWHFFGVRADGTMTFWTLLYEADKRRWSAHGQPVGNGQPAIEEHREAFLPAPLKDLPSFTGKIVDVLRKRLRQKDFAEATAMTMRVT